MVAKKAPFQLSEEFVADIYLTRGHTVTIQKNRFTPMLHILHNKQAGKVVDIFVRDPVHGGAIPKTTIRPGDRALMTFRLFNERSAFVRPGMRVILREGHILGYGIVVLSKPVW